MPMKTSYVSVLLSAALLPLAAQAQPREVRAPVPPPPGAPHVQPFPAAPQAPVTFLGVETNPAGGTLATQLGLPKDTGLVVHFVVPDSPAAAALKPHDVLTRLNDQILIDPYQLGVLVRSLKEGEDVTLTFVRAGKSQTAKVKLGARTAPPGMIPLHDEVGFSAGPGPSFHARAVGGPGAPQGGRMFARRVEGPGGPGSARISIFRAREGQTLIEDGDGRLEISFKDGQRQLTAKNEKGETTFSGPIETPEQRKLVPADLLQRLEKLEKLDVLRDAPPDAMTLPAPTPGFRGPGAFFQLETDEDVLMPAPQEVPFEIRLRGTPGEEAV